MIIDGVRITADFKADHEELESYVKFVKKHVPEVSSVEVKLCDDGAVDLNWTARHEKFERIRRITGYLTGDLTTWNDAKQAEESDRVKHQ
ncbi:MAG: hypothetical protein IJK81_13470 [Selenomonadaceae bacterium]|nr:hypothetical protein [Selenomonadaceae bacterium]